MSSALVNLNQIAAGVREHRDDDWSRVCGFAREYDSGRLQPLILFLDVGGFKCGQGNPLFEHRLLKSLGGRIGVRLKSEFEVVRPFRRSYGDPLVIANRNLVLLTKAEHVRVKTERLVLVIDHYAGEFDSHGRILAKHSGRTLLGNCERRTPAGGL